jgi:hypothetical protein
VTPEEEVRRAGKAKEILDAEVFQDAVSAVEEALLLGIRRSAFKDSELREKLCQQYMLLHNVLDQLRTHIETGRLAEQTLAERLRSAFR